MTMGVIHSHQPVPTTRYVHVTLVISCIVYDTQDVRDTCRHWFVFSYSYKLKYSGSAKFSERLCESLMQSTMR